MSKHKLMPIYKILTNYLAIMEYILYTTIKAFTHRHVLPVVMCRIKLFNIKSSKLQWSIHIEVLIERWHCVMCLTTRVIEFRGCSILQLSHVRRLTEVDNQSNILE